MLLYIYSFTVVGHLTSEVGRYAWMVIVWKLVVIFPTMFGVWTPVSAAALHIDNSNDFVLGETEKDIGSTLSSILGKNITNTTDVTDTNTYSIGVRSVLLQLLPATTVLSLYIQVTLFSTSTSSAINSLSPGNFCSSSVCYFRKIARTITIFINII